MIDTDVRVEPRGHIVQFYESEEQLSRTAGGYLVEGLLAEDVAVVIATEQHRQAFATAIAAAGVDVAEVLTSGRLVMLDARETLDQFLVDDWPDEDRFDAVVGTVVRQAASRASEIGEIRAYGEMVALLWEAGADAAAIELEALWNRLGEQISFSLFCAYPAASIAGDDHMDAVAEVCHLHSSVIDDRSGSTDGSAPSRMVQTRTFAMGPGAPRAARHFVAETLQRWGHHELVEDASIVTTELVTNAVLHAESDAVVTVSWQDGGVRVSVQDSSQVEPRSGMAPPPIGGRGLRVVSALSSQWSTELIEGGKVVWSLLDRRPQVAS